MSNLLCPVTFDNTNATTETNNNPFNIVGHSRASAYIDTMSFKDKNFGLLYFVNGGIKIHQKFQLVEPSYLTSLGVVGVKIFTTFEAIKQAIIYRLPGLHVYQTKNNRVDEYFLNPFISPDVYQFYAEACKWMDIYFVPGDSSNLLGFKATKSLVSSK